MNDISRDNCTKGSNLNDNMFDMKKIDLDSGTNFGMV